MDSVDFTGSGKRVVDLDFNDKRFEIYTDSKFSSLHLQFLTNEMYICRRNLFRDNEGCTVRREISSKI